MAKPTDSRENSNDNRGTTPPTYNSGSEVRRTDEPLKGAGWNRGIETMGTSSGASTDQGTYYRAALQRSQQRGEGYGVYGPYGRHSPQQSQGRGYEGYQGSGENYEQNYGQNYGQSYEQSSGQQSYRPNYGRTGQDRGWNDRNWGTQSYGEDQRAAWERTQGWGQGPSDSREEWESDDRGRRMTLPWQRSESRTEGRRGRWRKEALSAREVMTRHVRALRRTHTLRDAAQIMKEENVGIVPVVDDNNRLIGVLTDRDIVIRAMVDGRNPQEMRVEECMSDDIHAVHPEERVVDVVELMGNKQIRRVPVVDRQDQLVGIIAMADIATRADTDEDLQDALEKISATRSFWSRLLG